MKKIFETPELIIVLFSDNDIIMTSGEGGDLSPDVGEGEGE